MLLNIRVTLKPIKEKVKVEEGFDNPVYDIKCDYSFDWERNKQNVG